MKGHARRWLQYLDKHRRTVLDLLGVLLLLSGLTTMVLAVIYLYPADGHRLPGTDVLAAGSTAIAAGGILLGIGGPRDDHGPKDPNVDTPAKAAPIPDDSVSGWPGSRTKS